MTLDEYHGLVSSLALATSPLPFVLGFHFPYQPQVLSHARATLGQQLVHHRYVTLTSSSQETRKANLIFLRHVCSLCDQPLDRLEIPISRRSSKPDIEGDKSSARPYGHMSDVITQ
jgi:hypothetical protein